MCQIEKALTEALLLSKSERDIQPFLKRYSLIVLNALNARAWNYSDVIPEFQLGNQYRADFLIISADSGSWHAIFVELKSHQERLFTKNGVPTRSLSIALRQLDNWEQWISNYEHFFRMDLSRYFRDKHIPAYCSSADSHNMASEEIIDPRTNICKYFKVIIGRRDTLSDNDRERRISYLNKGREIVTYDRFLDAARKLNMVPDKGSN